MTKDISQPLFECIIKHAKILCPNKRKPRYTHEYYLKNILKVLSTVVTWSSLKDLNTYNGKTKYHYKTISDIHKLWSDTGVYEVAYIELVQTKNILIKNKKLIELLIDSTLIINRSGVECIGYGTQDRKKKFTKLTALTNMKGENVAINVDAVNKKKIEHVISGKNIKKVIPTLSHDVMNVESIVKKIRDPSRSNIRKSQHVKLYGDKGYTIKQENQNKLNSLYDTKLVHNIKKNHNKKNTKKEEKSLKSRINVEHMFSNIKVYNRIHVRRDKTISSYLGFVYLGCIIKFGKVSTE